MIKNGHAEVNTTGWTVSKNTSAASRPDSGFVTSSTNITWTRNTTNPIDGQADFLYTKDAANRQGEQVYYGFTVSKKHRAKVLQIEVDYLVNSGTFSAGSSSTDSDIIAYIYDVTNSTFIEPSSIKLLSNSSTLTDKFIANFQTSATGSSYRILFHQATTSASAFAVQFKEIKISPCQYVYGTPITDWVAYTPTGSWSNTTYAGKWRRVGDSMEVNAQLTLLGTPTSATLTVALPSGYTIDTAKLANSTIYDAGLGNSHIRDFTANFYTGSVRYNNTTSVLFTSDNGGLVTQAAPMTWDAADQLTARFSVPITGWSSSVQVSDGYDGRQIGFRAGGTPSGTLTTGFNVATFPTVITDTTASHSSGTWTAPTSDYYDVSAGIETNQNWTAGNNLGIQIYANGGSVAMNYTQAPRTTNYALQSKVSANSIYLLAGQTIQIRAYTDGTGGGYSETTSGANYFSISRSSSATTMSATEVVAASYRISADKTPSASNPIDYDTKIFDTHNAVTTGSSWKFTAPVPGLYRVTTTNATSTTGGTLDLYVNGSQDRGMMSMADTSVRSASATVSLLAGGYISINPDSASKTFTGTKNNTIYIERIK